MSIPDPYECWKTSVVNDTIFSDIGATTTDQDALFLATHVSLPIDLVKPVGGMVDEEYVLHQLEKAIVDGGSQNLVMAITGPSGSGKSHLVRWLHAKLDLTDHRFEMVYVPRRVSSLREITHMLLDQLGGDLAAELGKEVDNAVDGVNPSALADALYNRIWESLKYQRPPVGMPLADSLLPLVDADNESAGRGGLVELMGIPKVREHFLRADGIVRQLAASVLGGPPPGESGKPSIEAGDKPSFTEDEINLTRLKGVRPGLAPQATTALNVLGTPAGREATVMAMNAIRDAAVQHVFGMRQGRGLREVFAEARRRVADRDLILMFEDLARMDYVEGAVLDEFANHGDDQHAPLRVIFAVTDDKYATLAETIEGRVTNRFSVGEVPLHNVVGENEVHRRDEFVARYLNAARVGKDDLMSALSDEMPFPNACENCRVKEECQANFGFAETSIGRLGLYPYNRVALGHGIRKQYEDRHRDGKKLTARFLIEQLVEGMLREARLGLDKRTMPTSAVWELLNDKAYVGSPADLVPEYEEGTDSFDRLFRVRSLWFDGGHELEAVATAFTLPDGASPPPPPPPPPPPRVPWTDDGSGTQGETPLPLPLPVPPMVKQVLQWEQSGDMDSRTSTHLRQLLRELTEARINLGRFLIHSTDSAVKDLLKQAFGDASFNIDGASGRRSSQLEFSVHRSNASARILIAALWFQEHGHWEFEHHDRTSALPETTRDAERLPIELETFLAGCAGQVEAAVVAVLFKAGVDPVSVAVHLKLLADRALLIGEDPPNSWFEAFQAALLARESGVADDVVRTWAAARQSSAASPAVIDSVRTARRSLADAPRPTGDLATYFPTLAQRWGSLLDTCEQSVEPLSRCIEESIESVDELAGGMGLSEVGDASLLAIRAANSEGALSGSVSEAEDAAMRIRDSRVAIANWSEARSLLVSPGPFLDDLLELLPDASDLLSVGADLSSVNQCLSQARLVVDSRLDALGDTTEHDRARRELWNARVQILDAAGLFEGSPS